MKNILKTILISLLFISMLNLPIIVNSESTSNDQYKILGSIGGPTNTVAVSGNYVYAGKGTSLIVLENSGGRLTQVGKSLNFPSFVSDVKIAGKLLYAAVGSAGLHIIDISQPLNPVEKGVFNSPGFAESVAVAGTTAYLANGDEGLQTIDVSNPANPAALGQAYKGRHAFGIAVRGNYAYIAAADDGLLVADVSQKSSLKEITAFATPGIARNVTISGEYAYIADDWKGVAVADITDPSQPAALRNISTAGRAYDAAVNNNYLYVADAYMGIRVFDITNIANPKDISSFIPADSQMMRVAAGNGFLYCADRTNGVLSFDISKQADLKLKGFYSYTIPIPLFIPSDLNGEKYQKEISELMVLGVLDAYPDGTVRPQNNITRAELATVICMALKTDISHMVIKKADFTDVPSTDKAFKYIESVMKSGIMKGVDKDHFAPGKNVTNEEAVDIILSILNHKPKTVDGYMKSGDKYGLAMFIDGNMTQFIRRGNILTMLLKAITEIPDARTQTTLIQSKYGLNFQASPISIFDAAIKGGYAFVSSGTSVLTVVDIQEPGNMRQVAHINLPENILVTSVMGDYAYVSCMNNLYVVDISDPLHPIYLSSIRFMQKNGPPRSVKFDSDRMYVADEWGFEIISLREPSKPIILKTYRIEQIGFGTFGCASDIAVKNGIAYVALGTDGIKIYDVSDTDNIKYLGDFKEDNLYCAGIEFSGNRAFAEKNGSVEVLDISDMGNPKIIGILRDVNLNPYYYKTGFRDNLVFLPNDSNGVMVADITNVEDIKKQCDIDTVGMPGNILSQDGYIYVCDGIGGLSVIGLDKTNGSNPANDFANKNNIVNYNGYDFNTKLFKGDPAEKYNLNTDKTIAAVNNQRSTYSETLTVTNTNDSGKGSLRWCLENIKQNGRILFDKTVFSPTKPAAIFIKSTLDFVTGNITIDASNAGVLIDGSKAQSSSFGIHVMSDNNVIKGLKIQNCSSACIEINGKNNIIGGSRNKGKSVTGEGNVLVNSSSLGIGIVGQNATDNIVVGNNIGVDSDGITPGGNNGGGIAIGDKAARNVIGAVKPEYRNIISGNSDRGIMPWPQGIGNLIEGNYVGTDITGTKAIGNYSFGISFELGSLGNIAKNNVCCGNGRQGICISGTDCNFNVIIDNSVGIGADGQTEIPNKQGQFFMDGCSFSVIGGRDAENANIMYPKYGEENGNLTPSVYDTIFDGKVFKYSKTDKY